MVELSSLDVSHLARELEVLEDAFIEKAYQTAPSDFLLRLRHRQHGRYELVLRPGAFAALAKEPPQTPTSPSTFAMALRKALANARVRRVRQHEFDRVLVLDLERGGQTFRFVVELFGKGNLIVAGPDDRIQLALRSETFAHRVVKRGEPFVFPPSRPHPSTLDAATLAGRAAASKRDIVRFLAVEVGLGGDLAEASLAVAGFDRATSAATLDAAAFGRIVQALKDLLARPAAPRVLSEGATVRLASLRLPQHTEDGEAFSTLSEAVLQAASRSAAAEPEAPDAEAERLQRQRDHQARGILELEAEAQALRKAAQAITARTAEFGALLDRLRQAVTDQGWEALAAQAPRSEAWPEVRSVDPRRKRVVLAWSDQTITVDPEATVESNASAVFDQAKAVDQKAEGARHALAETEVRLRARLKRSAKAHQAAVVVDSLSRRRFWFSSYRWFVTTSGLLAVAGRDAPGNERLVKKHLKPGDVYAHADVHGAPSVVLKAEGVQPDAVSLEEACRFAATYSKAFQQFAAADAFWVRPEQVSKTAQSGEFVPKGAFIIRGQRNWFKDLPLEAGVGIVRLAADGRPLDASATEGHRLVMGGPWVAVAAHCRPAVKVVRGTAKASTVAKEAAALLEAPLDAVAAALPTGTLAVAEVVK